MANSASMAINPESAKALFGPESYPLIKLLSQLNSDDDDLRKPAKALIDYTKKNYPNSLIEKLFETIQRSQPSSRTGIFCYKLLSDILLPLWPKLSSTTQNDLMVKLYYKVCRESDYETLNACCSCVSSIAGLLFPKYEWNDLFVLMIENLGSDSNRNLGVLLLWDELIPKCPEIFVPFVDCLIEGFTDLMPTITEEHRSGVLAARASVKLILYLSNPASYCKFYGLLGHVLMTLIMACSDEEVLVCSVLEDLIVLAGVETAFFEGNIGVVFESMVKLAECLNLGEKSRQLAIEFVVTVAENREIGCGMIEIVPKEEVTKLLNVLIKMLVHIEDDPRWRNAISDDKNEGELSMCSYGMESLERLAIALGGDAILPNCPACLFKFLDEEDWRIRHAAVTAIGLISEGCSKALLVEMVKFGQSIVNLMYDSHPRVRWATIRTIGQLSTYLSPRFQEEYLWQLLPAFIEVLDDFHNPRLQTRAASVIWLFSHNCRADDLKPYLHKIVSKLVGFLQRGMTMRKEAALETLASLAISLQEDSAYIYDSIMPYLKVILETATKDTSRTLLAKSMECITRVTMAFGNQAIHGYVEKVTAVLISLQETQTEIEDPMRKFSLLAYGRLCKCLGEDFLPYLSLAMPIVLKSAQLSVSNSSDTDDSDDESMIKVTAGNKKIRIRSALLEEKALACHMLCCFAAELKGQLHLWVNEVVSALVPNLTFEFSEEVRMTAISAMPLLLNSASCAMKKGLPVTGCGKAPVQKLSNTIIPSLLDALKKESKVQVQARLLEAFNESIQIPGSHLSKHQAEKFVEGISKVLLTCSYCKTEREKRAKEHTDSREQKLLKEEAQQHLTICRNIGICLETMVKILKASFLPLLDKFLPYVSLMWSNDRTAEERRIVVHLFREVAEQCREEAFRYYEEWIPLLLKVYYHKDPDVPQIVAIAIGICAEFGADFLKPHTEGIFGCLKTALEHPNAKYQDNIMAYEAAVYTCGKLSQFLSDDFYTYEFIQLWISHLPIRCNLDEAKISHELLCSMIEMFEQKVIGPQGFHIPKIIAIFAEVLWAGNNLATEETKGRIINLLKKFQRELQPPVLSKTFETLPLPHQNLLRTVLSTL
ncbi:importin-5-like isoform X2 [Solanum tuberosum]|uniref:importin-5-like isoform X2 n=1 Tax=Solanum tuberosum TaxID=4113 RepID=UPI0003D26437|nr:PREDICTED: importin-5-like isoform X2 [Solanum tuberosum]